MDRLAKARKYKEDNKEQIREKNKIYKQEHQVQIKAYRLLHDCIKCQCECGGSYLKRHKSTHFKTKKHLAFNPHPTEEQETGN